MKKRKIKIVIIGILCIGLIGTGLYFWNPAKAKPERVTFRYLDFKKVTKKDVECIKNMTEDEWSEAGCMPLSTEWQSDETDYGYVFEIDYAVHIDTIFEEKSCRVSSEVEIEGELKNYLFCYEAFPDEPFNTDPECIGRYIVTVYGITKGKSKEELQKLIDNVTLHLKIQNANTLQVKQKTISYHGFTPKLIVEDGRESGILDTIKEVKEKK